MSITVIKEGHTLGRRMRGECMQCGCVIKCDEVDAKRQDERDGPLFGVKCPTQGCGGTIWVQPIAAEGRR